MNTRFTNPSSATAEFDLRPDYPASTPGNEETIVHVTGSFPKINPQAIENAVYAYISAVRALGRTSISTSEIAVALGVSAPLVESTLEALKARNVKIVP